MIRQSASDPTEFALNRVQEHSFEEALHWLFIMMRATLLPKIDQAVFIPNNEAALHMRVAELVDAWCDESQIDGRFVRGRLVQVLLAELPKDVGVKGLTPVSTIRLAASDPTELLVDRVQEKESELVSSLKQLAIKRESRELLPTLPSKIDPALFSAGNEMALKSRITELVNEWCDQGEKWQGSPLRENLVMNLFGELPEAKEHGPNH